MARRAPKPGNPQTAKKPMVPPKACVAVAAAHGSRNSLNEFVSGLPANTEAAFVFVAPGVRDGDPDPFSDLPASSSVAFVPATDGTAMSANHGYLCPPGQVALVKEGRLRLFPATPSDGRIDSLLVTVAEAYEENSAVVLLGDLGSDGVAGVAATKRLGGLALAEGSDDALEPAATAVTAAGIADMRLPAGQMGAEIAGYLANIALTEADEGGSETLEADVGRSLSRIAAILRNVTGNDFHGYKHATFVRRIQRRMQVIHANSLDEYIEVLRRNPQEVQHLFQDLLISVTQFFRDPAEFELLEQEVIPKIFEGKGRDDRIRVWVLGCATGEEAYSLAILLRERMAQMDTPPQVQIFATDIDARALAIARGGRYPEQIARHISPERLARWFIKENVTYVVSKELREICIFSPHNITRDAPFSKIDLLSCRNLLIYLNSELQDRAIPIFHFSLNPGGYLFLGPAENVTRQQKLFTQVGRKSRVFRRLDTPTRVLPDLPFATRAAPMEAEGPSAVPRLPRALSNGLNRRIEHVAERYAPAFVVVDGNHDVLHFSGRTGRFLEPATGAATLNLLNLAHRDLRLDLRTAMHKATSQHARSGVRNIRVGSGADARAVSIVVEPVSRADESTTLMVVFQDDGPLGDIGEAVDTSRAEDNVQRLEAELRTARERLQTTIEELESTNEELKSSNEEYQSINEELQSANEELETSKEELQAVNEELHTVNGELAHRVSELAKSNSDLKNLLESTRIPTVFLDNDLRLQTFTPVTADIFHIIDSDVGRPIAHLTSRLAYPQLQDDARRVLSTLGRVEREVEIVEEDRRFLVRVLPYRSVDNFIGGVVMTFLEITSAARAEAALKTSERRFSEAQQLAGVGVWEWSPDTDQTWWSPTVYDLWGLPKADAPPDRAARPVHEEDRSGYLRAIEQARAEGVFDAEWRVVLPDGSVRWLAETGRLESSQGRRMLGITQDITHRKQTEMRLTLLLGELQHRVRNILGVVRSIVSRTVRSSSSLSDLASRLDGRLQTLARTQAVFTRTGVLSMEIGDIVRDELSAVGAREDQLTIEGPSVRVRREAAQSFALALHELTTNAVKYGAFAEAGGRLSVTWRIEADGGEPRLSLEWKESGVRVLDIRPSRAGFGRELIERSLPYELGAETRLEFEPGGVRALIELPLNEDVAEIAAS